MENEIRYVKGCLDCPFYSFDTDDEIVNPKYRKAWCGALDQNIKYYQRNQMPKDCPLQIKNITIAADLEK